MPNSKIEKRAKVLKESIMNYFTDIDERFKSSERLNLASTLERFKDDNPKLVCKLMEAKFKNLSRPYQMNGMVPSKNMVASMVESFLSIENGFRVSISPEAVERYINVNGDNDIEIQKMAFEILTDGLGRMFGGIVEYNGNDYIINVNGVDGYTKVYSAKFLESNEELSMTFKNGEFHLTSERYTIDACKEITKMGEVIRTFMYAFASRLTAPRYSYEREEKVYKPCKELAADAPRKASVIKVGETLNLNSYRGIIMDGVEYVGGHHRSPRKHWRSGCVVRRKNGTVFTRRGCWVMEENESMEYVIK